MLDRNDGVVVAPPERGVVAVGECLVDPASLEVGKEIHVERVGSIDDPVREPDAARISDYMTGVGVLEFPLVADHVDVEHAVDRVRRSDKRRVRLPIAGDRVRVRGAAVEPQFLATEQHEADVEGEAEVRVRQGPGGLEHSGHPRRVVVGATRGVLAPPEPRGLRDRIREGVGGGGVVVRADHVVTGKSTGSGQHADNVVRGIRDDWPARAFLARVAANGEALRVDDRPRRQVLVQAVHYVRFGFRQALLSEHEPGPRGPPRGLRGIHGQRPHVRHQGAGRDGRDDVLNDASDRALVCP